LDPKKMRTRPSGGYPCDGGRCATDGLDRQGAERGSGGSWTGLCGERTGLEPRRRSDGHRLEGKLGRRDGTRHAEFGEKVGWVRNSASMLRSADTSTSARRDAGRLAAAHGARCGPGYRAFGVQPGCRQ
jgi:hypothetical protein